MPIVSEFTHDNTEKRMRSPTKHLNDSPNPKGIADEDFKQGLKHEFGLYECTLDASTARTYYESSSATEALFRLGLMQEYGQGGFKANPDKAKRLYLEAEKKGSKDAKFRLNYIHLIEKQTLREAFDDSPQDAVSNADALFVIAYDLECQKDYIQAAKNYLLAQDAGNYNCINAIASAAYRLGCLYLDGKIKAEKKDEEAIHYLQKSLVLDCNEFKQAQEARDKLFGDALSEKSKQKLQTAANEGVSEVLQLLGNLASKQLTYINSLETLEESFVKKRKKHIEGISIQNALLLETEESKAHTPDTAISKETSKITTSKYNAFLQSLSKLDSLDTIFQFISIKKEKGQALCRLIKCKMYTITLEELIKYANYSNLLDHFGRSAIYYWLKDNNYWHTALGTQEQQIPFLNKANSASFYIAVLNDKQLRQLRSSHQPIEAINDLTLKQVTTTLQIAFILKLRNEDKIDYLLLNAINKLGDTTPWICSKIIEHFKLNINNLHTKEEKDSFIFNTLFYLFKQKAGFKQYLSTTENGMYFHEYLQNIQTDYEPGSIIHLSITLCLLALYTSEGQYEAKQQNILLGSLSSMLSKPEEDKAAINPTLSNNEIAMLEGIAKYANNTYFGNKIIVIFANNIISQSIAPKDSRSWQQTPYRRLTLTAHEVIALTIYSNSMAKFIIEAFSKLSNTTIRRLEDRTLPLNAFLYLASIYAEQKKGDIKSKIGNLLIGILKNLDNKCTQDNLCAAGMILSTIAQKSKQVKNDLIDMHASIANEDVKAIVAAALPHTHFSAQRSSWLIGFYLFRSCLNAKGTAAELEDSPSNRASIPTL